MKRLFVCALLAASCRTAQIPLPTPPPAVSTGTPRGEFIVRNAGVCGGCHAAGRDPDSPLSGGKEFRDWRIGVARGGSGPMEPIMGPPRVTAGMPW